MLYKPWRNLSELDIAESNEFDYDEIYKEYLKYREIINRNKLMFESVSGSQFDQGVEDVENFVAEYEDEVAVDAKRLQDAQIALFNREFDVDEDTISSNVENESDQGNADTVNNSSLSVNATSEDIVEHVDNVEEQLEEIYGFQTEHFDTINVRERICHGPISFPDKLSQNDFFEQIKKLNRKQQILLMNIIFHVKNHSKFYIFLNGGGGIDCYYLLKFVWFYF